MKHCFARKSRNAYGLLFALKFEFNRRILGSVYNEFAVPHLLALHHFGLFLLLQISGIYGSVSTSMRNICCGCLSGLITAPYPRGMDSLVQCPQCRKETRDIGGRLLEKAPLKLSFVDNMSGLTYNCLICIFFPFFLSVILCFGFVFIRQTLFIYFLFSLRYISVVF